MLSYADVLLFFTGEDFYDIPILHLIAVVKSAKITSTYLIFSKKENHTIKRTKALPDVIGLIGMVSPLVRLNLIPEKMRKEIRNFKRSSPAIHLLAETPFPIHFRL